MILFKLQKKELLRGLDQIKIHIKPSKRIYEVTKFIFLNNKLTIRIVGSEVIIPCNHEGGGQFEMYLTDFYEAIKNPLIGKFDEITFIVSQKQIQINNRNLSILSSDFNKTKSKKTLESPLGTLNFVEENGLSKLYKAKTFVPKNQEMREHTLNNILNDINKGHTILKKYGITIDQIHSLVFENLRETK